LQIVNKLRMTPSRAPGSNSAGIEASERRGLPAWLDRALPALVLIIGFVLRLIPASRLFLNPDEALHNLLASQSSVGRAWDAALTNAHPPLLILLLYYWRTLGHSELWLRMPSVLAGTAACWFFYQWLKLAANRTTAILGLLIFSFAPSLILLSAEIRQYALLLFFMTACLYLAELALRRNSTATIILFSLSLYGALLTHYSALIFALVIGIYMLVRLSLYRARMSLCVAWGAGQIGGIAIASYFLLTHIPRLRQTGMVRADLESYLRKSVFHPGERNPFEFVAAQTLRVFTYIASHGLIGGLMLLLFLAGMVWLLRKGGRPASDRSLVQPSSRELALLLGLPFLVTWGVALAGLYPLGATRHDAFLAPFAIGGVSIGIAACVPGREWMKSLGVILCLAVCNVFPAPSPPIRAKDQSLAQMRNAMAYVQESVPTGSVFLADYESGLLLGRYLCGHGVVQIFSAAAQFSRADCGPYTVIATSFHEWKFVADTFAGEFSNATKFARDHDLLTHQSELWLFYAGWINDSAPAMKKHLAELGCPTPQSFGENILVCKLRAEAGLQ
jgi:hypothetical protein